MGRLFRYFFVLSVFCMCTHGVYAQECLTQYEEIVDFRMPFRGANNVWASVSGKEEYQERFSTAVRVESHHIVAAGLKTLRDQRSVGPELLGHRLMVAEIDLRGRVAWESVIKVPALRSVEKILSYKGGFVVLASVQNEGAAMTGVLVYLDGRGQVVEQKKLAKRGYNLHPRDIVWDHEGEGFRLVATLSAFSKTGQGGAFSVLYGLSGKGRVLWERSYRPGLSNMVLDVERSGDGNYVLSGQIENAQKRQSGWVVAVAGDGEILWQQQYARGDGARLMGGFDFPGQRMVVVGQVLPVADANDDHSAAWVMMLDRENGNVLWQRYFRDAQNLEARDVLVGVGDGAFSVLLNSRPDASGENITDQFVRLLTLTPRGVLFSREDHLNGEGASGSQLLRGYRGQRIIVGVSQQAYDVFDEASEGGSEHVSGGGSGDLSGDAALIRDRSLQGFVLSATAPAVLEDECQPAGVPDGLVDSDGDSMSAGTVFP